MAVVDLDGKVLANRNVSNRIEQLGLSVIGGLPTGTPVAFEAAASDSRLGATEERRGPDHQNTVRSS
jgi:hypothetical protein